MALTPLRLPPGVYRNGTKYQTKGRWFDSHLVRWFEGTLRPVGGWQAVQAASADLDVAGVPRALLAWSGNDQISRLAIGTNTKLYAFVQGVLTDITPAGLTAGQESSTVDVGVYGQGAYGVGPYGAGDPGQAVLSEADTWQLDTFGQFLVGCLTSDKKIYVWDLAGPAYPVGAAVGLLTFTDQPENGETVTLGSKVYTFQTTLTNVDGNVARGATTAISLSNLVAAITLGAGAGTAYAAAMTLHPTVTAEVGTGTTLVATAKTGGTDGNSIDTTTTIADASWGDVTLVDGAAVPTDTIGVLVTPEGFLVALAADGNGRSVRWASQRTTDDWTPSSLNTAGDWLLEGSGTIMCGRSTKEETLIWTDADLHVMRYAGGTLIYVITQVDTGCGIVCRLASAAVGGSRVLWMGNRRFYDYNGFVATIPCDVSDYVFSDLNWIQRHKIVAVPNAQYSEVTWYYPSALSEENDRYVTYNYAEQHWAIGMLARTAGADRVPYEYPILAAADGKLYDHERGFDYDGEIPYAESGPAEMGEGDRWLVADTLIPDEKTQGEARVFIFTGSYPNSSERSFGPYSLTAPTSVRFKGRQARVRIEQVAEADWRVGVLRFDTRESSRR